MSITRINTNYDAMFAGNAMAKLESSITRATQRLSTGQRINTAADDPQGIAQLTYAQSQLRGVRVAIQNLQETSSLTQYQDAALSTIQEKLFRLRDITMERANDATLGSAQIIALSTEYAKIATTLSTTNLGNFKWNGKAVLRGGVAAAAVAQVGPNNGDKITLSALNMTIAPANLGTTAAPTTTANAQARISTLNAALSYVATNRANVGIAGRLVDTMLQDQLTMEAANAQAVSTLGDANMAAEITALASTQILAQAATAMLGQANMQAQTILKLLG